MPPSCHTGEEQNRCPGLSSQPGPVHRSGGKTHLAISLGRLQRNVSHVCLLLYKTRGARHETVHTQDAKSQISEGMSTWKDETIGVIQMRTGRELTGHG